MLLSLVFAAALVTFQKMSLHRILIWTPKIVIGCLILFSFFFMFKADYLIDFGHRYGSAFTVDEHMTASIPGMNVVNRSGFG